MVDKVMPQWRHLIACTRPLQSCEAEWTVSGYTPSQHSNMHAYQVLMHSTSSNLLPLLEEWKIFDREGLADESTLHQARRLSSLLHTTESGKSQLLMVLRCVPDVQILPDLSAYAFCEVA